MFFFVDVRDFHLTRSISWVFKSFLHFSFKSTLSLNHCNTSCQSNCYMLKLQFFGCFRRCLLHALQLMPFIHPSNQRNFVRCCPAYAHFTLSPFFRIFAVLSLCLSSPGYFYLRLRLRCQLFFLFVPTFQTEKPAFCGDDSSLDQRHTAVVVTIIYIFFLVLCFFFIFLSCLIVHILLLYWWALIVNKSPLPLSWHFARFIRYVCNDGLSVV